MPSRVGSGTYAATLHRANGPAALGYAFVNRDIYRLEVPHSTVFREPTLTIRNSDEPLTVELLDVDRNVLSNDRHRGHLQAAARSWAICASPGHTPTRYTIVTGLKVESGVLPGPLQEDGDHP